MNALTITPTDDQAAVLVAMNARANAGAPLNADGTPVAPPVKDEDYATTQIGSFLDTLVANERSTQLQNLLQSVRKVAETGTVADLQTVATAVDSTQAAITAKQPSPPIQVLPPP